MAPPANIHKQYKCNRKGGWGASVIVHERFANRVTFNTCGTNWVVVGFDFSELGWRDMGFVSAHLPPTKKNNVVDDADYTGTLAEIDAAILQLKKQMPSVRLFEGIDANVELPNLDDGVHTLTGELCTNHGTTSRALDFLEHMHKHGLRACNTWPTEAHKDHGSSWTCMGTRKELRLIDYICFGDALPYQVCYKEDVNTDHRAIHTSIPLAHEGAAHDHVNCFSRKVRGKNR